MIYLALMLLFFSGLLKKLRCPESPSGNRLLTQSGWELEREMRTGGFLGSEPVRNFELKGTRIANRRVAGKEGFTSALKTITWGLRRPVSVSELVALKCQSVSYPIAYKEKNKNKGFRKQKWNPKMNRFTFGAAGGRYLVDYSLTAMCLAFAYKYLKQAAKEKKTFLFVCTTKPIGDIVGMAARKCRAGYLTSRWRSGTLTNWEICRSRIVYFNALSVLQKAGKLESVFTKREIARLSRVRRGIRRGLGGLRNMRGTPDCVIVIDPVRERKAVLECVKLGIPVIAVLDLRADPQGIDIPLVVDELLGGLPQLGKILEVCVKAICEGRKENFGL